jgi:hypothetical protein
MQSHPVGRLLLARLLLARLLLGGPWAHCAVAIFLLGS